MVDNGDGSWLLQVFPVLQVVSEISIVLPLRYDRWPTALRSSTLTLYVGASQGRSSPWLFVQVLSASRFHSSCEFCPRFEFSSEELVWQALVVQKSDIIIIIIRIKAYAFTMWNFKQILDEYSILLANLVVSFWKSWLSDFTLIMKLLSVLLRWIVALACVVHRCLIS